MDLRHLRYFVCVAREGSFTRAAEILRIAQPPLSRQMQQLEDELGFVLIERGTRPLHLSEAGRLFYEQAIQVLERFDEMRASVGRLHEAQRDRFSIGFVAFNMVRQAAGSYPELSRGASGRRNRRFWN